MAVSAQRLKRPHVPRQPRPATMSRVSRKGTRSATRNCLPPSKAMPKSMWINSPVLGASESPGQNPSKACKESVLKSSIHVTSRS